jgi:hypothetical protein
MDDDDREMQRTEARQIEDLPLEAAPPEDGPVDGHDSDTAATDGVTETVEGVDPAPGGGPHS